MNQFDRNTYDARGYTEVGYGWDVFGVDGEKIGSIADIQPHYITVEKGFLFKEDVYIPTSTISSVRDEMVYLNTTKEQIETQGWDREPEMTDRHRETAQYNDEFWANRSGGATTGAGDRTHFMLAEEHLDVSKRDVERGSVHVHKDVVEHEEAVDVPLREEEVRVERHDRRGADFAGDVPADAFQEQDIDIPIRGEEADVTKRARVREEVDVVKDVTERQERVRDTVRREELHVDRDGEIDEERPIP